MEKPGRNVLPSPCGFRLRQGGSRGAPHPRSPGRPTIASWHLTTPPPIQAPSGGRKGAQVCLTRPKGGPESGRHRKLPSVLGARDPLQGLKPCPTSPKPGTPQASVGPEEALSCPRGRRGGQDSGEGRVRLGPLALYLRHVGKLRQVGGRGTVLTRTLSDPHSMPSQCPSTEPSQGPHEARGDSTRTSCLVCWLPALPEGSGWSGRGFSHLDPPAHFLGPGGGGSLSREGPRLLPPCLHSGNGGPGQGLSGVPSGPG